MTEPDWKQYEQQIYERLKAGVAADAAVTFDQDGTQRLPGRFSGIDRQIDVLVRGKFAGLEGELLMIVDCKSISRRLDVIAVETFAGLLDDVGTPLGLLVTTKGYSDAAERQTVGVRGCLLDVVPFDELAAWIPLHPTVAWTTGTDVATFTFSDEMGQLKTEVV
jgi:hypothetical protein